MPHKFWSVYNYVARQWYEEEMGKVEWQNRWYWNAMIFLEDYSQGVTPDYTATTGDALRREMAVSQ